MHCYVQVMVADSSGQLHFQPVFLFSHADPWATSRFIVARAAQGAAVRASPGHYIPASPAHLVNPSYKQAALVKMQDLQLGDWIWVTMDSTAVPSRVSALTTKVEQGLYNPHTAAGTILVDGIVASTFTEAIPASFAVHSLLTAVPYALYHIMPTWLYAAVQATVLYGLGWVNLSYEAFAVAAVS